MTLSINDLTDGGMPKVEVLLDDLDSDVATVTVYRLSRGSEHQVRGIINAPVSGGGSWVDFEVPARTATYRAEFFDHTGLSLGFSDAVTVELGYSGCWMHNPLAPTGGVRVDLALGSGESLSRPVPGQVVYPRGRRVGIAVTSPRRGLAGVPIVVTSHDLETADRIQAFLGGDASIMTPVICIRPGVDYEGLRVPSPLFLAVLDIAEEGVDVFWGGTWTKHHMQGDEAAPPAPGIFVPLLRRVDVDAYYADRDAIDAAYLRRLDIDRDYGLVGTAG